MKRELTIDFIKQYDITDPTPWEEYTEEPEDVPYRVLGERICPVCKKKFMSDEWIVCGSREKDYDRQHMFFVHERCMKDEVSEFLEKIGYSLVEDTGKFLDDEVES